MMSPNFLVRAGILSGRSRRLVCSAELVHGHLGAVAMGLKVDCLSKISPRGIFEEGG